MKLPHRIVYFLLVFGLSVLLAACNTQSSDVQNTPQVNLETQETGETGSENPIVNQESSPKSWVEEVPRIDDQGAVTVEITPINLNNPSLTLDFQVAMNTHSVDLSMDLTDLATLKTDTGHIVKAIQWDAPRSGHHVSGILSFPVGVDGYPLLEGASKMELTLVDLDATERVFIWER